MVVYLVWEECCEHSMLDKIFEGEALAGFYAQEQGDRYVEEFEVIENVKGQDQQAPKTED